MAANDVPPDFSQGYVSAAPGRCPYSYTIIVKGEMVMYRCELANRHSGDHREGGIHWQSQGIGFGVDPQEA